MEQKRYVVFLPMKNLPLQRDVIYGPVLSRRLGRSLGVNLLPTTAKICPFDCIYCQYGLTHVKSEAGPDSLFPPVDEVVAKVEAVLQLRPEIDCITFSGNGEPSMHPHFDKIVEEVRSLRDRLAPGVKLGILCNSVLVNRPKVRHALSLLDQRIMKLDAADPETFAQINRPAPAVKVEAIIEGLKEIGPIVIQTLMLDGPVQNVRGQALGAWMEAIKEIRPKEVQLYACERPPAEDSVKRLSKQELQWVAQIATQETGVKVRAY